MKYFRILEDKLEEVKQIEFLKAVTAGKEVMNTMDPRTAFILMDQIKERVSAHLGLNRKETWISCDQCIIVEEPAYWGENNDEHNPDEEATTVELFVGIMTGTRDPLKHAFAKKMEKCMFKAGNPDRKAGGKDAE